MDQGNQTNYNKYTIGKKFRKAKKLRKQDTTYKEVDPSPELQEYIDYLRIKGVLINKVKFAYFSTKNGLPYPGLVATDQILSNEILVQVPRDLLLTTKHAFMSPLKEIFTSHPQFYSAQFTSSSEDHMLLTYLLYEYQKGRDSVWFHLIRNLPREIDYLIFWDEKEQNLLQDQTLIKQANKQKTDYLIEYEILRKILSKYPQFFQPETYSEENVRWIYTHLVTRCFGKYLQYVTMVPFCELFNHECVDVYYDFTYRPDNPYKSEESDYPEPQQLTQEDEENVTTSEGSYNSEDDESDTEYELPNNFLEDKIQEEKDESQLSFYEKILEQEKFKFLEEQKLKYNIPEQGENQIDEYQAIIKQIQDAQLKERKDFNIKQSLQKEIHQLTNDIKMWIYQNIDFGDGFSIFFIAQIYKKIDASFNDYITGRKAYFMAREDMKRIQQTCVLYKNEIYKYNKDILRKNVYTTSNFAQKKQRKQFENTKQDPDEILLQPLDAETEYFNEDEKWEDDKFDNFIMKCSRKDQFEKNSQVYFCYGRLSNRMMLMRYGMTLEYNKYDHVHLRIDFLNHLKDKDVPELMEKIKGYHLSKYKRFKLKSTQFPIDLILFCKALHWTYNVHSLDALFGIQDLTLEVKALETAKSILNEFINKNFQETIEENEKLLSNNSLGYHEHFAVIYRLERQRIISLQMRLIQICIEIFNRMHSKGMSFEIAALRVHDQETADQFQTHRLLLAKYFNMIKFNFYLKKQ